MLEKTIADQRSAMTDLGMTAIVRIGVVIPYFQRKTGILARALRSIKDQRFTRDIAIEVLVVDDGSPMDPEAECAAAGFADSTQIRIIKRPNGGPGAARNTGLDAVDPTTDFVAFLDSDDIWQPDHLQHAVDAMGQDCDFYFCDHHCLGKPHSYFATLREEQVRYKLPKPLVPGFHQSEIVGRLIYMDERSASLAIVRRYLAHTSTIVFRRNSMTRIRFLEKLRFSGEDYLFSLELAHAARKSCCSHRINVYRGNGIDLYTGSSAWDHPHRPRLVLDDLKCFLRAKILFVDDEMVRIAIHRRINTYRTEFIWLTLRNSILTRRIDWSIIQSAYQADRRIFLYAPTLMLKAIGAKLIGRPFIAVF